MGCSDAQLSPDFYSKTCPNVFTAVKSRVESTVKKEPRMGASLLCLFFHDCFVNGCDGWVLLDNTPTFTGEKNAAPNRNSARGFEVIDDVKSVVEKVCPGIVSCADLLAITARNSIVLLGGPSWNVKLGRRDARTVSQAATNSSLPSPASNLIDLISSFENVGLSTTDLAAVSGSHSIGQAKCANFRARIYNETDLDRSFGEIRRKNCPSSASPRDNNLAPLDLQSPVAFDNTYYTNLLQFKGLLHSNQQLFSGDSTDSLVRTYASSPSTFSADFTVAMIKMGDILPLTGSDGEVRKNCRKIN